ncbi:hypothetical protein SAMN04487916_107112 [Arthrobacter sp. ov407]|nr:hypothetical protein SAMN04487916_107112 [Arthrobacter sp. ov407]
MISEHILRYPEKNHDRKSALFSGLFPGNPENLGTQIFSGCGVICATAEIAINTVMAGRMRGQKPPLTLQFPTFLPDCLQAHTPLMSGNSESVTALQKIIRLTVYR